MSKQAISDARRGNFFWMKPNDPRLHLVTDKSDVLYDPGRVEMPVSLGLVEAIRLCGIIEPIRVRKNGPNFDVVVGRQRVKAARELARQGHEVEIPCIPLVGDDGAAFDVMLSENAARVDDPPSSVAEKLARGIRFGRSEKQLAAACSCSIETVRSRLKLLEAAPAVRKAVDDGTIGEVLARQLTTLPRGEQVAALEQMVAAGHTKGAKARKLVADVVKPEGHKETGARKMTRKEAHQYLDELAASQHEAAGVAVGVVRAMLGDRAALGGKYRSLRPSFWKSEE